MLERDSSIDAKAAAASTDLMRRRVFLPYASRFVLRESAICIKTDSTLMGHALNKLNVLSDLAGAAADAEWEIAVETQGEPEAVLCLGGEIEPIEVHRFGPSYALRMGSGSWFAHTPPSLNGTGFAMVAGSECDQIHQLCAYLGAILNLLEHSGAQSIPALTPEVTA